jgi:hypothetical protein
MAQTPRPDFPYISPDRDYTHPPHLWLLGLKSMDGETEKCYIRKIIYFKHTKPSFHEFLLAEIIHPFSLQVSLAVIERAPKKTDDYAKKRAVSPSISGSVGANDTVRIFGDPDISKLSSHNKLAEMTFEHDELPLLNFAILLTVISKHAPNYDVWEYQCYWFADTIYQSVQTLFKPSKEHVEPALSKHRGKFLLGLPLRKDSVGAIIGEYEAAMEDDRNEKARKANARLAEEKKVGFSYFTAMLRIHVIAVDRATRPGDREKRERKEGECIASGEAKGAGTRVEDAGKRKEGQGNRDETAIGGEQEDEG